MTTPRCHDCNSAFTVAADRFGNWRCFQCLQKWVGHIEDVIDTVDGKAWCQYGGLAGPKEHIIKEDRAVLVLSRKRGEMIQIGDNVVIEVTEIRGSHVKLGIHAPATVKILRTELDRRDQDHE